MKILTSIAATIALAGCSGAGSDVNPGEVVAGCAGLTFEQWSAIPSRNDIMIMNGTSVESKLQRAVTIKAKSNRGRVAVTTRAPSAIGLKNGGNSAYVMINSPSILTWNNKVLKCKAA